MNKRGEINYYIHEKIKIYSSLGYSIFANELIYLCQKKEDVPCLYLELMDNGRFPISLFNSKYIKSINMYFDKLLELYDFKIKVFIYEIGYSEIESLVSSLHS